MVVELVQVVVLVVEALGAKLLAHDIARQTRVRHELPAQEQLLMGNLPVTTVGKTRLP